MQLLPDRHIVCHYPLNGTLADCSMYGAAPLVATGSIFGEAPNSRGLSAYFDGVDDHLRLATEPARLPIGDSSRTMCIWILSQRLPSTTAAGFCGYGTNSAHQMMSVYENTQTAGRDIGWYEGGGVQGSTTVPYVATLNEWHHFAMTHAVGGNGFNCYHDGRFVLNTATGGQNTTLGGGLDIGAGAGGTASFLKGFARDFIVLDIACNRSQLAQLMLGTNPLIL